MRLASFQHLDAVAATPEHVLCKAATRAAALLHVTQAELSSILGLSAATVSRMAAGTFTPEAGSKACELATLFVRVFRSLDALVGSNDAHAGAWFDSHNEVLEAVPRALVKTAEGLVRVVHYLDAARGRN